MSPWTLLGFAAFLLALPVALKPRPTPTAWDFRGPLALLWYGNVAYCAIVHRLDTRSAPLPDHGPAILIANHTCNIDHCLLQAATGRKLSFLIAREYYEAPLIRPFCRLIGCIPVDEGRFVASLRASVRALKEGQVLAIFPEGRMIPTSGRELGEGKEGTALIAIKARVPVIPAYIRGTPESRVVWKSALTPSNSRIVFGPAILPDDPPPEDERAALASLTARYMDAIKALQAGEMARDEGGRG